MNEDSYEEVIQDLVNDFYLKYDTCYNTNNNNNVSNPGVKIPVTEEEKIVNKDAKPIKKASSRKRKCQFS